MHHSLLSHLRESRHFLRRKSLLTRNAWRQRCPISQRMPNWAQAFDFGARLVSVPSNFIGVLRPNCCEAEMMSYRKPWSVRRLNLHQKNKSNLATSMAPYVVNMTVCDIMILTRDVA